MILLLMITLSSLKSGQSILIDCSEAEYYCPPTYECRPREQRCTESDNCTYPNNDDMCFSDGSNKSFAVRVGYLPIYKVFGKSVISHPFIRYRGFTYEYFHRGVKKWDSTDIGSDWRFRNAGTVGYSSCTYEEVATITAIWDKTSYNSISHNCISFSEVMVRFLMSDKCEGRKKKKTLSFIFG